jgi:DNA-binding MarR family transcriptional regulator
MLSQRALDQRQLSVAEWRILVFVGEANLCSARDIVQNSDMDHVVVHRAVVRLEERDFLYRIEDPGNRRLKLLRLSAKGARVLEEIIPVAYEIQDELLSHLSAEDEATLRRILSELMTRFGSAQGKAPVGRRSKAA